MHLPESTPVYRDDDLLDTAPATPEPEANDHRTRPYGRAILFALNLKPHVFSGVAPNPRRRAKNRVARLSRRRNRG